MGTLTQDGAVCFAAHNPVPSWATASYSRGSKKERGARCAPLRWREDQPSAMVVWSRPGCLAWLPLPYLPLLLPFRRRINRARSQTTPTGTMINGEKMSR